MSTILTLKNITSKTLEIETKFLDKTITVAEADNLKSELNSLLKELYNIASNQYSNFKKFCQYNKELYSSFYCMFRNTDRIVSIRLKPSKDAIFILLNNTFDNCNQKTVVLIPFEFIESPEKFLITRMNYVKEHYRKGLSKSIIYNEKQISKLNNENKQTKYELENFDGYFKKQLKELRKQRS